ncbi:MAG: hypothetical protein ABGY11_12905 [Candidatus Thioglobus sp.]|jgi:hypothetical protein
MVNWNDEATTEAIFKHYEDDGRTLKIYIDGQESPIKCTSSHTGDYEVAVEYAKLLQPDEKIKYWSRGVDVYSSKEWFYKIQRA